MSNFEEQTRSERPTLTWEGRTLGQEIDTLFKDLDITQESLMNGDEQAEDKALQDGEFIEFGLGNINNGICLNKVSNG